MNIGLYRLSTTHTNAASETYSCSEIRSLAAPEKKKKKKKKKPKKGKKNKERKNTKIGTIIQNDIILQHFSSSIHYTTLMKKFLLRYQKK